jgi:hypothetical protein
MIAPGLGLSYKFHPYLGKNIIPIAKIIDFDKEKIIDFDKELRTTISAATIKDYPWRPN